MKNFSFELNEALHVEETCGAWSEVRIENMNLRNHRKHTYSKI
jgi:hypothetical protein